MAEFGRFPIFSPKSASGAYTMGLDDNCILHTAGSSDTAVTLPLASQVKSKVIYIQKVDAGAGATVITRSGSDTIGNASATTVSLATQFLFRLLMSDGVSRWIVLSTT
jgi:hypothetical protein